MSTPRDRLLNHIDTYVNLDTRKGQLVATFMHCNKNMLERATHFTISIPGAEGGPNQEGVIAKLMCVVCKASFEITLRPSESQERG